MARPTTAARALEQAGLVAAALRRSPRPPDRALPGQPERLARRHHRADDARRPRHHLHAAPGARLPRRAVLVAPARLDAKTAPGCASSGTPASGSASRSAPKRGVRLLLQLKPTTSRRSAAWSARASAAWRPSARRLAAGLLIGGEPERRGLGARLRLPLGHALAPFRRRGQLDRSALPFRIARVGAPAVVVADAQRDDRHRARATPSGSRARRTCPAPGSSSRSRCSRTCASRPRRCSWTVMPWPPRSTHGVAPCCGQLSRPSALLTATIDSVISFATAGASLPDPAAGLGAGLAAPSAMNAATSNSKVTCMARSLRRSPVAQHFVGFGCDAGPHEFVTVLALNDDLHLIQLATVSIGRVRVCAADA